MKYYGSIYKITNTLDGKTYIGQTTQSDPWKRIKKHFKVRKIRPSYISKAIQIHGKENFKFEILCSASKLDDLNYLETYFISYYNCLAPLGYNFCSGGKSQGKLHNETKLKISSKSKEYYRKYKHPFKGTSFSKEHRENLSKVRKGFDSEARKKAREEATKKKMLQIKAIHRITKETFVFNSISECAKKLKLDPTCISRASRGSSKNSHHKGWTFERVADGQKSSPPREYKNYCKNGTYWSVYKNGHHYGSFKTEQEAKQKALEIKQDGKKTELRKKT